MKVAETLNKALHGYNVHFKPFYAPVKIDSEKTIDYFKYIGEDNPTKEENFIGEKFHGEASVEILFDLLHQAPLQTAPNFTKESSLVNNGGWIVLYSNSMQHKKYGLPYMYWNRMMKGKMSSQEINNRLKIEKMLFIRSSVTKVAI